MTSLERVSFGAAILWGIGVATVFIWGASASPLGTGAHLMIGLICAALPAALTWLGVILLRAIETVREESAHLEDAIDGLRSDHDDTPAKGPAAADGVLVKLDEIAARQRGIEAALDTLSATPQPAPEAPRPAPAPTPAPPADDDQVTLPLDMPAEDAQPGLSRADFLGALNFPQNMDDTAGFTALRGALRDRSAAQIIRAAQDILTLMSQDGIYMDDLHPDMAHPDLWRRFASGERGRTIASLGGVHDQAALDVATRRMKQDAVFRDVAHHFLRLFDRMLGDFAPDASDAEIAQLAQTRTARAFMLLGRVAGTFD
ncbi:hypothetical protein [Roseovarius sp. D22-M7]|uniref:hypothetical protein n=1 Tax=Roseovarius sp. D22-M7 TaxID=3127116 RepID=UPI00300F9FDF